jgi:capsule polysaccharide export protein KpsE/RkpR
MSQLASTRQTEDPNGHRIEEVATPDFDVIEFHDKPVERLRLLWGERRFLWKTVLIGLVFSTLVAFLIPKHYESTAQLMPPDSTDSSGMAMMAAMFSGGGGGTGGGLGALAGDLLGLKNTGAVFVGILRSRTVQDRLVARFNLQQVYGEKYEEDACKELSDNTDISEDRKSGIITIEVTDKDPQRAAAMAQAYVDELNRLAAEVSTSAAHRERVFLEGRLQEVKRDLNKAATDFSQFASKNTTINIEEQGKAMVEAAAAIQGQLMASESELKGLEQIYTPNNVRIRSVKSRIAELRAQLEQFGGKAGVGTELSSTSAGSLYPSIRQLPLLGVKYFDLYREAKIQEAVYEALTQQFEMAKVQEAKETPSVKVLDSANVPETKSFPPRLAIIFLALCLTAVGGAVWVLQRARWERTDANDPRKVLALEVFRTVNAKMPWSTPNGSRFHTMTHKAWVRLARRRSGEMSVAPAEATKDPEE